MPESSFEETSAPPETTNLPDTLEKIVALARGHDERILAFNLENYVQVIDLAPPHLTCALTPKAPPRLTADLVAFLTTATGQKWIVEQKESATSQTIKEQKEEKKQNQIAKMQTEPVISDILKAFPGAKITGIKTVLSDISDGEEKNENFS